MVVDAVAAIRIYGAPAIVIDMGTATTFSAIGKKGRVSGCGDNSRRADFNECAGAECRADFTDKH